METDLDTWDIFVNIDSGA